MSVTAKAPHVIEPAIEAHRLAQSVRDQMESLLLRDAPRIADAMSQGLRELETRLGATTAELQRVERARSDLQRLHDALQERHAMEVAKHEELKREHGELLSAHAAHVRQLEEMQRAYEELSRQREKDALRLAAVERFLEGYHKAG